MSLDYLAQTSYEAFQHLISVVYACYPSPNQPQPSTKRIAIIGAGITGVSSAAHCVSHGFEVVLFEKETQLGGIWAKVNSTSGLQLNSLLYRFHPTVIWSKGFPNRDEILNQVERIWNMYGLESRTRFNYHVTSVIRKRQGRRTTWVINDGQEGEFDGLILAIGTCSDPCRTEFPGLSTFQGEIVHSSELDRIDMTHKRLISLGSGASGVEVLETAIESKAIEPVIMLARSDKWIIPRNVIISATLALQPFTTPGPLTFIAEKAIKAYHYRGVEEMVPQHESLYGGTPIVNDAFLELVKSGKIEYLRGNIIEIVPEGVRFNLRSRPGQPTCTSNEILIPADILVDATGFERPSLKFLPYKELFPIGYGPPNLYLQAISTEECTCVMINSAYENAFGSVGLYHIGIYTRMLLCFILDPGCAPEPEEMKQWVDVLKRFKQTDNPRHEPLGFFTYMELMIWLVFFHFTKPSTRLKWIIFNLYGFKFFFLNEFFSRKSDIGTLKSHNL